MEGFVADLALVAADWAIEWCTPLNLCIEPGKAKQYSRCGSYESNSLAELAKVFCLLTRE